MRKPAPLAFALLALGLAFAGLALAHDHGDATPGTWKGEIVDVACYVPHGVKGEGHADCAKKCAKAGEPIGLLTGDGDLLLLVADHDDGAPFEAAKELAGKAAEVTGTLAERDGVHVLTVTSVKAAS
jgi:hypothetical protein